ncbi:MAG: DUF1634 domain-containing protein [Puniceicoccales bacterium]|jgi:uncharacterized membrane protein|nr:DUF1634 domain-containing protein [Puniceicoccales bacterium]
MTAFASRLASGVLEWGVRASLVLMLAGVALGHLGFQGFPEPDRLVRCGLVLLIATPMARVGAMALASALARDWIYVAITTLVLVLLAVTFFLGKVV